MRGATLAMDRWLSSFATSPNLNRTGAAVRRCHEPRPTPHVADARNQRLPGFMHQPGLGLNTLAPRRGREALQHGLSPAFYRCPRLHTL